MSIAADPTHVWTLAELSAYNGADSSKPILLGCKATVFDVTAGGMFYGPDGPYREFSGHDASLCLATMAVKYNGCDLTGLNEEALGILDEWDAKFRTKYPIVGIIKDDSEPNSSHWFGDNKRANPSEPTTTNNNTQSASL